MDKETLSNYGWIVICVLVLTVMIALATPFGTFVADADFADKTRTTAQIVKDFYRTIRNAAGDDVMIIGCNTISHLSAGMFEIQRTGDDTSGHEWKRTREYGINTLAFRMAQQDTFYQADADCVGITGKVAWEKNRQWLDVLAKSGTPLFVETIIFSSSGTTPMRLMDKISSTSSQDNMSPRLTMSIRSLFTTSSVLVISFASNKPIILSASRTAETSGVVTTKALVAPAIAFLKPCSIPVGQSINT